MKCPHCGDAGVRRYYGPYRWAVAIVSIAIFLLLIDSIVVAAIAAIACALVMMLIVTPFLPMQCQNGHPL